MAKGTTIVRRPFTSQFKRDDEAMPLTRKITYLYRAFGGPTLVLPDVDTYTWRKNL